MARLFTLVPYLAMATAPDKRATQSLLNTLKAMST